MQVHSKEYTASSGGVLDEIIPLPHAAPYKEHFITISRLDADSTSISFPSGSVIVEASDDGHNFGTISNGTIDLTTKYDRPNVLGYVRAIKTTFSGLPAAAKIRVLVHSYS